MTKQYSDPFGIQQSTPLSRTLRRIELQSNVSLFWPEGYLGPDYVASINLINPAAAGFSIRMPSAGEANEGTGMLFMNVGAFRVVVLDHTSVQITDLEPGESKYMFCSDNSSDAGEWRVTGFGATTSAANALALAGAGVAAIGGRINAAYPIASTANSVTVTADDRAKIFVAKAGSVTVTLPAYTIGNNFFVGVNNAGSGTVTIVPPEGTIDGFPSLALAPNESVFVFCSGTPAWHTIGYGRSTEFQFTKLVKDVTAGGDITLTSAEASNKLMQFIGTPASNVNVIVPSVVGIYYIQNSYSGPNTLTVKTASGSGVALTASDRAILYCDGVNVVAAQSAAVGTNISIVDGSLPAPSISFAADPNTGIYRADVDTMGIASDGKDAARFHWQKSSISGKLGVGTTNPASWLHINSGAAEGMRLQGTGAYHSFWNTAGDKRVGVIQGNDLELRDTVDGEGQRSFYINNVKRFSITKDGIQVNGTITSLSDPYATLGDNTFTGIQQLKAERFAVKALGSLAAGTANIDLSLAGTYTCTVTGVVNFTFSNKPPAGYDQTVYLKITNGAAFPPNWPAGTRHPKGVKPVLSAGIDLLAIWYDVEQAAHVVGLVWPDMK